jgi:hypothetical protein
MSDSNRLTEKQLKNIDKFNSAIKTLCKIAVKLDPNNASVDRIQKQISLFVGYNPVDPIKLVAPFLYKYNNKVLAKDSDFFISGGIQDDLKTASSEILEVFQLIAGKWTTMSKDEINLIWEKIDIMSVCINNME